jgi:hypothetical protein
VWPEGTPKEFPRVALFVETVRWLQPQDTGDARQSRVVCLKRDGVVQDGAEDGRV